MPLEDWFDFIELDRPTAAQQAFLRELAEMLDQYQPELLDPGSSEIRSRDHDWAMRDSISLRLVHREDAEATVEAVVDDEEAIVAWLTMHQHIYRSDDDDKDSLGEWTSEAVGFVAAVLRGDFEVEDSYRGVELMKTRLVDRSTPEGPEWVSSTWSLAFWRFLRRPKRVVRRRIDFGV